MSRREEKFLAGNELHEWNNGVEEVASKDAPHSTDHRTENGVTNPVAVVIDAAQADQWEYQVDSLDLHLVGKDIAA